LDAIADADAIGDGDGLAGIDGAVPVDLGDADLTGSIGNRAGTDDAGQLDGQEGGEFRTRVVVLGAVAAVGQFDFDIENVAGADAGVCAGGADGDVGGADAGGGRAGDVDGGAA